MEHERKVQLDWTGGEGDIDDLGPEKREKELEYTRMN
jgi:hypothetical protein